MLHKSTQNHDHLSAELNWGILASKLRHNLYFKSPSGLSARETAASFLLLNLGNYASAIASKLLIEKKLSKTLHDESLFALNSQHKDEIIPQFEKN